MLLLVERLTKLLQSRPPNPQRVLNIRQRVGARRLIRHVAYQARVGAASSWLLGFRRVVTQRSPAEERLTA
jgi:hypothetical protein